MGWVLNLFSIKSVTEVRFCTTLCASLTNRVPLICHLPDETRTYKPKIQTIHQEKSFNTLISIYWKICCLGMVFMYCYHMILYNSIKTNYNTNCPTSYPSLNPTFYLGQNRIVRPGMSSEFLYYKNMRNPLYLESLKSDIQVGCYAILWKSPTNCLPSQKQFKCRFIYLRV